MGHSDAEDGGISESANHRQSPVDSAGILSEATPLIGSVDNPSLYRTISHQSNATHSVANDNDLESSNTLPNKARSKADVYATIAVLLLGVFISNTDQSLVVATYNTIASDFNDLNSGTWLMSGFILAQCVVQPLYGKLSDIYGRKACLQVSYMLFIVGTLGSGLGQSLGQVIAARFVQGAGSAGMGSMVSIIITDLVPMREVAAMRSYVNILHTTGRSCGGVIGGYITQKLNWRWAFLIQVPPTVLALVLVQWRLHLPSKNETAQTVWQRLKRIDFVGSFFLCFAIFAACFVLEIGGQKIPWDSPILITIAVAGLVAIVAFVYSARFASEPIFPLRLVAQYDVVTNYVILTLQTIMQMSLMTMVAVYFQVTQNATTAAVGGYIIPAFVGNTIGGLASGFWIKRTGRYKTPTILAPLLSLVCLLLCYFRWNGHTSAWESLYTLPGGLSMGLTASATFVALAAGVSEEDVAVTGSGAYLVMNIGAVAGVSLGAAIFQNSLRSSLEHNLKDVSGATEIIRHSLADVRYVQKASRQLRDLIVPCFVEAFHAVNFLGFACAGVSLLVSALVKEHRILTEQDRK